tara:strand:+ start:301 stop:630 length:330 start_codon:yes stop_codon:yes gene_type:complete
MINIKPGLNVCVDFQGKGIFHYRGLVVKKLRKNWLVRIPERATPDFNGEYSIAPERMVINFGYTKEGRPLLATKEDTQYLWSKEHVDYCNSFTVPTASEILENLTKETQ